MLAEAFYIVLYPLKRNARQTQPGIEYAERIQRICLI